LERDFEPSAARIRVNFHDIMRGTSGDAEFGKRVSIKRDAGRTVDRWWLR
jgi:hypothetical protein